MRIVSVGGANSCEGIVRVGGDVGQIKGVH